MKKRKPPILAVTILCICAAVAFALNYKAGIDPNAPPQTPSAPASKEATVGQSRPTESVAQTATAVAKQMGTPAKDAAPKPRGPMGRGGGPSTIAAIKPGSTKPVPNDSSIASQWYHPESSKN